MVASTHCPQLEKLEPLLPCHEQFDGGPLLLIMWDEARTLVRRGMNRKGNDNNNEFDITPNTVTRFRILRRALAAIGGHDVRMFTIVTDTSSRIANFQPSYDHESDSATDGSGINDQIGATYNKNFNQVEYQHIGQQIQYNVYGTELCAVQITIALSDMWDGSLS